MLTSLHDVGNVSHCVLLAALHRPALRWRKDSLSLSPSGANFKYNRGLRDDEHVGRTVPHHHGRYTNRVHSYRRRGGCIFCYRAEFAGGGRNKRHVRRCEKHVRATFGAAPKRRRRSQNVAKSPGVVDALVAADNNNKRRTAAVPLT